MTTTSQIAPQMLTSILDGLFVCDKTATPVASPEAIKDPRVIATYKDMEGNFKFATTVELSLANSLGAALAMIPAGGAEDATAAGIVPANIGENLYEVLNIASSVFADWIEYRIVLDRVYTPGDEVAPETVEKIDAAECLLQLDYELGRYQPGKVSLLQIN